MKNTIDEKIRNKTQSLKSYRIPEGYFETLPNRFFERIDSKKIEAFKLPIPRNGSFFVFVRPYLYMAATFLIVTGTFKLFDRQLGHTNQKRYAIPTHGLVEINPIFADYENYLEDFDLIYADLHREKAEEQWLNKAYSND